MEAKFIFAVRLPERKYHAASGSVDSVMQANHFETLEVALEAATDKAVGVSKYDERMQPLEHLSLEDAQKLTSPTEED